MLPATLFWVAVCLVVVVVGGVVGVAWVHWDLGVEYFGYVCGCLPLVFSELLSNVSMGKEKITSFRILILIFAIN